jgi:uncharacterized oxidoreductase
MRTSGHTALVTGGSSGIGLAIAQALAEAGNTVVIAARDPDRLAAAAERVPGASTVRLDLADPAGLPAVLDEVSGRHGPLTMLVNNAAVYPAYRFTEATDEDNLDEEIATNVLGTLRLTRLALPHLRRQPAAAVVNLSSVLAYVAAPDLPVYAATKAALHSFSRSLRAALADTTVKVFDVLPPLVDTPGASNLPGAKLPPEAVARALLGGLAADRYEIHVGRAGVVARLSRLAPTLADRVVARAVGRPAHPVPSA